jgi:hypothetical protein
MTDLYSLQEQYLVYQRHVGSNAVQELLSTAKQDNAPHDKRQCIRQVLNLIFEYLERPSSVSKNGEQLVINRTDVTLTQYQLQTNTMKIGIRMTNTNGCQFLHRCLQYIIDNWSIDEIFADLHQIVQKHLNDSDEFVSDDQLIHGFFPDAHICCYPIGSSIKLPIPGYLDNINSSVLFEIQKHYGPGFVEATMSVGPGYISTLTTITKKISDIAIWDSNMIKAELASRYP